MDLLDEIKRRAIELELNDRLAGTWTSHILPTGSVIIFQCIDMDGKVARQYSWAIAELQLAYSTQEVVKIISRKHGEALISETYGVQAMKKLLRFK